MVVAISWWSVGSGFSSDDGYDVKLDDFSLDFLSPIKSKRSRLTFELSVSMKTWRLCRDCLMRGRSSISY